MPRKTTSRALHPFYQHCSNTLALNGSTSTIEIVISGHYPVVKVHVVRLWLSSLEAYHGAVVPSGECDNLSLLGKGPRSC